MPKRANSKNRHTVSLEPDVEEEALLLSGHKGISFNRFVEKALAFYCQKLKLERRENGEIVGFVVGTADHATRTVSVITT